jgi:hypothetical protein
MDPALSFRYGTLMSSEAELKREAHQTLVVIRTLLAKLTPKARLEFFDSVESGYCVGCGVLYRSMEGSCTCLEGDDDG